MKCKLCGSNMKCLIAHGKDYFIDNADNKEEFQLYYCSECKIGYTYPEMDDDTLSGYYPGTYEAYVPKKNLLNRIQIKTYNADITKIKKVMTHKNIKVFEIGAGRGQFLSVLRDRLKKIKISGVEQSETGVKNALKQYGITLDCKTADNIVFTEKYNIIIMRHVLEHLNNFDKVLQNIYQNGMETGGILFLKLPRLNSYEMDKFGKYWHGLDLPRHRIHFTDTGIRKLLQNKGFKKIKIYNEIVPSDYDRSMQYKKMGKEYLSDKLKIFRYIGIELKLLRHHKRAGRMIVIAEK